MIKVEKNKNVSFLLLFWFLYFHACKRKRHSKPIICRVGHFVDVSDDIDYFLSFFVQLIFDGFYFLVSDVGSKVNQNCFQLKRVEALDLLQEMIAQSLQVVGFYEFYVWAFLNELEKLVWYIDEASHFQDFKMRITFSLFCQICDSLVADTYAACQYKVLEFKAKTEFLH